MTHLVRKWTKEEIARRVESEGLYYTLRMGIDGRNIEDPELSKVWLDSQTQLEDIVVRIFSLLPHLEEE
jgi:hypothetical protein